MKSNEKPNDNSAKLNERIIELEANLTHLQKNYDELNEVVVEQSKRLVRLERGLFALENQIKEVIRTLREPRDPDAERPPQSL